MMAQVQVKGFRREIVHRLICFNLFWHALDIVLDRHLHDRLF